MTKHYIEFDEDTLSIDPFDGVLHNPLDGVYSTGNGRGLLAFGRSQLSQFSILKDIKVFYLSFYSDPDDPIREAWADPVRSEVLKRLLNNNWNWYLSMVGNIPSSKNPRGTIPLNKVILKELKTENLGYTFVQADEIRGESKDRIIFETNTRILDNIVLKYWGSSSTCCSIQGYQLPAHRIDQIDIWNSLPRDEMLLRRVIEESFIVFYAFPEENRHFAFLTNKLSKQDMEKRLDIPSLNRLINDPPISLF